MPSPRARLTQLESAASIERMPLPPSILNAPELSLVTGEFPATIDLEPGAVRATVSLAHLAGPDGDVACWIYTTEGLAARNQREIVLPVRIPPARAATRPPTAPLQLFATIARLAAQNRLVDDGGVSELGGPGFLGGRGIVYVDAPSFRSVTTPRGGLLALRVTAEELAVLRAYGAARLLASWGAAHRHYPFPPWSDETRATVVSPEAFRGSMLDAVPRLPLRAWARRENDVVRLEVLADEQPRLAALEELPPNAGFALLTHIDPTADGCLVWRVGQREAAAITPPGSRASRLAGCFVLVAPSQPDDRGKVFEDGFAFLLRDASTAALRRALVRGEPLDLAGSGGELGLTLSWVPTTYRNPVDGSVLGVPGGLRTYAPEQPAPPAPGRARTANVVLLTPQDDLAARVETGQLAAFVRAVSAAAEALLGQSSTGGWEAMVDVKLAPGQRPALQWMTRGAGVDPATMDALAARAAEIEGPVVRGEVALQVFFAVGG